MIALCHSSYYETDWEICLVLIECPFHPPPESKSLPLYVLNTGTHQVHIKVSAKPLNDICAVHVLQSVSPLFSP